MNIVRVRATREPIYVIQLDTTLWPGDGKSVEVDRDLIHPRLFDEGLLEVLGEGDGKGEVIEPEGEGEVVIEMVVDEEPAFDAEEAEEGSDNEEVLTDGTDN